MTGLVGEAFVRIRPLKGSFKKEAEAQILGSMRTAGIAGGKALGDGIGVGAQGAVAASAGKIAGSGKVAATSAGRSMGLASAQAFSASFGAGLGKVGSALKSAIVPAAKATAVGIVGVGVAAAFSVRAAANFETTLSVLKATSGATAGQMKSLSATALALGRDAKLPATSAKDAAEAMTELAKGGLNVRDTMNAARGVLQLSAAAQISNADAAKITADSLNAFGLAGTNATKVADLLAAAANATTADIPQMGQALAQSSTVAKQFGLSVTETVAALGEFANAGIKGSDAGTSLKTMLARLLPDTNKAKKAMAQLGVTATDSKGEFLPLRNIIGQYNTALKKLTPAERAQAIQTIFGSDARRAANILFEGGVKAYDKMTKKVSEQGAAQKLAEAQTAGFNGAMKALKSEIETIQIEVGLKLLPLLTRLARWFTSEGLPALRRFADFAAEQWPTVQRAFETAWTTIVGIWENQVMPAFETVRDLFNRFRESEGAVAALVGGLVTFAAQLVIIAATIKVVSIAMAVLNVVMAANPFVLIALAIAALVAGLVLLYQRSETARRIMDAAFKGIKAAAQAAFGWIKDTAIPALKKAFETIAPIVQKAMKAVELDIRAAVAVIRAVWGAIGPQVVAVARAAFEVVASIVRTNVNIILGVIKVFDGLLRGDWGDAWNALKSLAMNALTGTVNTAKKILTALAPALGKLALAAGKAVANGLKAAATNLVGLAGDIGGKVSSALAQVASQAYGWALGIGASIANGVIAGLGDLAARGASKLDPRNWRFGAGAAGAKLGFDLASSMADGLGRRLPEGMRRAINTGLAAVARDARSNMTTLASGLATMIGQVIDAAAAKAIKALHDAAGTGDAAIGAIEGRISARQQARQRRDLDQRIAQAQADLNALGPDATAAERAAATQSLMDAQEDLTDFLDQQEAQRLRTALDAAQAQKEGQAAIDKAATEQKLADLASAFTQGLITQQQYLDQVNGLLTAQGVTMQAAGDLLGLAFASGFRDQVTAMVKQVAEIIRAGLTGADGPEVVGTAGPVSEQLKAAQDRLGNLSRRRKALVDSRDDRQAALAKALKTKGEDDDNKAKAAIKSAEGQIDRLDEQIKDGKEVIDLLKKILAQAKPTVGTVNINDTPALLIGLRNALLGL